MEKKTEKYLSKEIKLILRDLTIQCLRSEFSPFLHFWTDFEERPKNIFFEGKGFN